MHPGNIGCLTTARIDCCCLANNHVLDWGYRGLAETLQTLKRAGVAYVGVGRNAAEAAAPAVLPLTPTLSPGGRGKGEGGRVLVFAFGSPKSGIPWEWGATENRPGLNLLADLSESTARRIGSQVRQLKQPGDITLISIHWGGNWGYEVPAEQQQFAHYLIDEGVDIVHGRSSHHVKAVEVYRERLVLYGCGDFLSDYEGISGQVRFRSYLVLMYLVKMDARKGGLREARLVPLQSKRFRLSYVSEEDAEWLYDLLNRLGAPFDTQAQLQRDNSMTLRWR
jgi:poly-gamma-glutamate synthesis protein (capsule biosynthesis protein)